MERLKRTGYRDDARERACEFVMSLGKPLLKLTETVVTRMGARLPSERCGHPPVRLGFKKCVEKIAALRGSGHRDVQAANPTPSRELFDSQHTFDAGKCREQRRSRGSSFGAQKGLGKRLASGGELRRRVLDKSTLNEGYPIGTDSADSRLVLEHSEVEGGFPISDCGSHVAHAAERTPARMLDAHLLSLRVPTRRQRDEPFPRKDSLAARPSRLTPVGCVGQLVEQAETRTDPRKIAGARGDRRRPGEQSCRDRGVCP